jgi:hypothetical protein
MRCTSSAELLWRRLEDEWPQNMVQKKCCLTSRLNRAQWRAVDTRLNVVRIDARYSVRGYPGGRRWESCFESELEVRFEKWRRKQFLLSKRLVRGLFRGARRGRGSTRAPQESINLPDGHPTSAAILGGATDGTTSAAIFAYNLDVPPKPSKRQSQPSHSRTSPRLVLLFSFMMSHSLDLLASGVRTCGAVQ